MITWTFSPTSDVVIPREIIHIPAEALHESISTQLASGSRLALACAIDDYDSIRLVYVFANPCTNRRTEIEVSLTEHDAKIGSLAALSFPASRFEREFHDLFGIKILNHPLPRRLVRHGHWPASWYPMRHDSGNPIFLKGNLEFPFIPVKGPGIYEIPVGPIHAGLIEPGHFRFYAVGETIIKLKIRLWYLHKGLEKLFEGNDVFYGLTLSEKISGDTSVGHSLAYALAVEEALGITVDEDIAMARAMLLELERLYNHVSDIGSLANDVGFSLANAQALVLREKLLRINEQITGHRLLRGAISIGGVHTLRQINRDEMAQIINTFSEIYSMINENAIVRERFTGTATLRKDDAILLDVLGPTARASGISSDARIGNPFINLPFQTAAQTAGDVMARFQIRANEFENSAQLLQANGQVFGITASSSSSKNAHCKSPTSARGIGIVEGWRGTITTRVEIDSSNRLSRVKIVDPSWFNWPAIPIAMSETIVPDFPLANKSFNLSYSGNDL